MSENGEIYTAGKKFTLPPAVTAWTNLTSANPFFNSGVKVKCKVLKSNICSYRKNCFVELTELFGFCLLKVILLGRRASLSNKLESEKTSKGLQKRQGKGQVCKKRVNIRYVKNRNKQIQKCIEIDFWKIGKYTLKSKQFYP